MRTVSTQLISSTRIAPKIAIPVVAILLLCGVPMLFLDSLWIGVGTFAILLLTALGVLLSRVKISADENGVHARSMGIFNMNFRWSEITSVGQGPDTGLFEGAGYRQLPGGTLGLLVGGPTIAIYASRRAHLLSANDPEKVAAELNERLGTSE